MKEILSFKETMKKSNLKNETMKESDLKHVYNYIIYPRDSKITTKTVFVYIDNGEHSGTHWTCFLVNKDGSLFLILLVVSQISFYFTNYQDQ